MNAADFMIGLGQRSLGAGVLVLLVLIAQRVFRRHLTPQWACALWLLVMVRLLPFSFTSATSMFNVLPLWSGTPITGLEPNRATITAASVPSPPVAQSLIDPAVSSQGSLTSLQEGPIAAEDAARYSRQHFTPWTEAWPTMLFYIWLVGALLLGGYVFTTSILFGRETRRARPVEDRRVLAVLRDAGRRMGVPRLPIMMESRAVAGPALHGFISPCLLLPEGFTSRFSADELRFVFLHELAHVRRFDLAVNWLVTALQIAHWFNPLVWFAFARWRVDREIACDALALEAADADSRRNYGRTILHLLESLASRSPQPGLVGILESRRQLARRMRMIANFAPTRRRGVAIALIGAFAVVGLTDAEVSSAPAKMPAAPGPIAAPPAGGDAVGPTPAWLREVRLDGKSIVLLVSGAEQMLAETAGQVAHWRQQPEAQRRDAPKWQRTADTLYALLAALAPGTHYEVLRCEMGRAVPVASGIRGAPDQVQPLGEVAISLRNTPPRGGEDLEAAFLAVRERTNVDRVVLIVDGLPGHSSAGATAGGPITEAQRIKFFEAATRSLPARVPVSTVLLPHFPGDRAAAGLYWELANATRGALVMPASAAPAAPTHIALVVDTSGSMRDPKTGGLWPIVIRKITDLLDAHPQLVGVQLLDGDGRFILGPRRGTGADAWRPATPESRGAITRVLAKYDQDSISNPVPGVRNTLRFLHDKDAADMRIAVYVLGDEFIAEDFDILRQLDEVNPRAANGQRPIVINAIGFPTTVRYQFSMGNTGLKFARLMRRVTHEHGGTFIALPELQ